ncbi:uncharacterized protein PRCAT00001832001 [Priceomyces carsonii]|uniref:uncharacterized protein n=1 Tax=Priceomyces carsonii TaxID=28549 RepID=UPI002ED8C077|nr:unnamed protein product [Priceomyces carsonii]
MSEQNRTEDGDGRHNPNSFASILAGVQRMRKDYGITEAAEEGTSDNHSLNSQRNLGQLREHSVHKAFPKKVATTIPSSKVGIVRRRPEVSSQPRVVGPSEILVHKSQKGNPLLEHSLMKNTSWSYDDSILSDYYINPTLQILFLSLKYFKLHPEYIWQRLKKLNKGSIVDAKPNNRALRILLAVVDIDSHQEVLCNLLDICIKHDLSLVLAWSFEEAGNYIVFARQLDDAPAKRRAAVEGLKASDYNSCVVDSLSSIRLINKTDVSNLLANCKSIKNVILRSCEARDGNALSNIGGLGSVKIGNMKLVFLEPFIYNKNYEQ